MQTRHLKSFIEISRVHSFATAAGNLNMTLSALSMQMKTLEEELDVALFDRNYRPPKLTPIGREVANKAALVLEAQKDLLNSCVTTDGLAGNYRIGFVATASVRLLPLFLKNASSKAPSAHFEIETALSETLEEKVVSGQLDAGILTASKQAESSLNYKTLREETLHYASPKSLAHLTQEEIADTLPFLQFNPGSGIGKLIANHVRNLTSKSSKQPIVLDSVEAIMECVNKGIGYTLLAEPDIRRYANSSVNISLPDGDPLTRKLVLATLDRNDQTEFASRLAELFDE